MKSIAFILALCIDLVWGLSALACGVMSYEPPCPSLLHLGADDDIIMDQKTENLLLWQNQTSDDIPLADIEEVIYGDLMPMMWDTSDRNRFIQYLYNTRDKEAMDFIWLAMSVAELRADHDSPWYYPASEYDRRVGFDPLIDDINRYEGSRFYNRYSLQLIRALFASARYRECIDAFRTRFDKVPDNDLMKRMATDYMAGATVRLGDSSAAKEYFASTGDVVSLIKYTDAGDNALMMAAMSNPDSPRLLDYIDNILNCGESWRWQADTTDVAGRILPAVKEVIRCGKARDMSPWLYAAAYIEGEFMHDLQSASRYIDRAYRTAAEGSLKDWIRMYRMSVNARTGRSRGLLADLRWLESKVLAGYVSTNVMQRIIHRELVPYYNSHGDVITALQLANYGDNMPIGRGSSDIWQARKGGGWNDHDYSNLFFQYLNRQPVSVIERYIASLGSSEPLAAYLNSRGYTDRDYMYDAAGTVALRNRNYSKAERLLSKISPEYQKSLNVYRGGYLARDPFVYIRHSQCDTSFNVKLRFAVQMASLERTIRYSPDADTRAEARIGYAIGLSNSFTNCWALTQYSQGVCWMADSPELGIWVYRMLDEANRLSEEAMHDSEAMIEQALDEFTDRERLAQAHMRLLNYATVARYFRDTTSATELFARCDQYRHWRAM